MIPAACAFGGNFLVWPWWSQCTLVKKIIYGQEHGVWSQMAQGLNSLPFICCVTLGKSLILSGLQFLYQRNENNSTALMGFCEG